MQPKKELKVQYIGIFEEIDSFLLTKNALLKRGPKNLGMGRPPPPLIRAMPERKHFFFKLRPSLKAKFSSALYFLESLATFGQRTSLLSFRLIENKCENNIWVCVGGGTEMI